MRPCNGWSTEQHWDCLQRWPCGLSGRLHRLVGQGWGGVVVFEEGLKDEGGGDLIDDFTVLLAGVAGFVKDLVGFAGGEALVP